MSTNVHHLELFYYVARHGGITAACKAMPFGIQQPAVSGQVLQLEEAIGTKLFQRRPFALTPAGQQLYRFISPFFSQLDTVVSRIGEEEETSLRVAATSTILGDHLPSVLAEMRDAHGGELRLTMHDAESQDISDILLNQESDIVIAPRPPRRPVGVKSEELLTAPLLLLVREDSDFQSFEDMHDGNRLTEPLILPVARDLATTQFREGMVDRALGFQPTVEVHSADLVPAYVRMGFGVGLAVVNPGVTDTEDLRQIPLEDFPGISVDAFYVGELKPLAQELIDLSRAYIQRMGLKS